MKKKMFIVERLLLGLFLVATMQSCFEKFYKVAGNSYARNIDSTIWLKENKYFILTSGDKVFHMENIVFDPDNNSLTCNLSELEQTHYLYINADPEKDLRYRPSKGESLVLNEVHVYIPADSNLKYGNNYILDLKKISKIEIIEQDKAKTTENTIWSISGIALGIAAIVGIIVAATFNCCF